MPAAGLTALSAALRTRCDPGRETSCGTPSVAQGTRWKCQGYSGAVHSSTPPSRRACGVRDRRYRPGPDPELSRVKQQKFSISTRRASEKRWTIRLKLHANAFR